MAEQIVYGVDNLLMKVGCVAVEEIGLMYGVPKELTKLQETLSTIKDVILDAEEQQQISELGRSRAIESWVRRLKDVVYDADDLFDDLAAEDLRRKTDVRGRFGRRVSDFFSSSNQVAFRVKMGHRVKEVRERMDVIANDISKFNFNPRVITEVRAEHRGRETHSVVEKSHEIVGRDENKREIIDLLMQSSTQENLSIVVIVGMGGLGKTTLAQLVCNDQRVVKYFDLKMWVCVSNDFDVKILVSNIIKSATNKDVENLELDQLQKLLQQNLDGKRYLLVLDDVWNEDVKKWGQLITLLPAGANGSKILATTRSIGVASVMGINFPYVLEAIKEDESWDLFESLAFRKGEEKVHSNLVAIGKDILKMCKGVPLVIETLGRMLYFKTRESQWLSIKNNKNLMLLGNENDILSVLKLSYDNLPIHLKQCFAYCALFPKDYRIEKKLLVQLWMAQGYLQASDENNDLEDVGDQYFEDLFSRSLFQEAEKDAYNNVLSCKMHDLIHDLAQSIVKSEVIILTNYVENIPKRIHHVSLFKRSVPMPKDLMVKPIRTLFVLSNPGSNRIARVISSFKCLRVMKLIGLLSLDALTSLAKLSHLRYLDLSSGCFEILPSAITRLKHLQTLKLFHCQHLKELPGNMKKLINLRHLEIDKNNRLTYMPCGLGELTMLQTLPLFFVGNDCEESRQKRIGRLSELKCLDSLRGELRIEGLSDVRGSALEAKEANLEGKQYLQCLRLYWLEQKDSLWGTRTETAEESEEGSEAVSVMESLQPHLNLKELFIANYEGLRFPNWMMDDGLGSLLPNLVKIEISSCNRSQVLPPFGQLPSLKYLDIMQIDDVGYMRDYPSSATPFFPSLKTLQLYWLPSLEGWGRRDISVEQAPSFPCLSILKISHCSSLRSLSLPSSPSCLSQLEIRDCPGVTFLQVPSFPCLKELWLDNTSTELCLQLISVSSSLKSLYISEIDDLISLPEGLRHLTSLKSLIIDNCDSLPQGIQYLTVLESLDIINCREVNLSDDDGLQFQGLRSLRHLYLGWIRKWVSLPKGLQHVSTLETLELNRLYDLATLPNWIASLTSLTKLSLEECPKLTSLPEEMRSLNNLHTLKISYCRNLVKRCKKEAGEDWPRISHIPEIIIRE